MSVPVAPDQRVPTSPVPADEDDVPVAPAPKDELQYCGVIIQGQKCDNVRSTQCSLPSCKLPSCSSCAIIDGGSVVCNPLRVSPKDDVPAKQSPEPTK